MYSTLTLLTITNVNDHAQYINECTVFASLRRQKENVQKSCPI